tara:strand:+ start:7486 stop:8328 length:843 start_codon:yes stop_codon:yes gene_type:complete
MTKHNKKRNVGLVYEQLLRYISENIINDNLGNSKKAVKILERRFKKDTELYKEFRLFNALAKSSVSGTHIAAGILAEAKNAIKRIDSKQLQKEKSLLIKDINYELNESNFYHRKIEDYKTYATIQTLFNEWRKGDLSNLKKVVEFERAVVEHLMENKISNTDIVLDERSDHLVFKVLSEKINQKYNSSLSPEQKDIIRNYAIYNNDPQALGVFLENLKVKSMGILENFRKDSDNQVLLSKIDMVYENINILPTQGIDDEIIKKFLVVSNLKDQLLRKENE